MSDITVKPAPKLEGPEQKTLKRVDPTRTTHVGQPLFNTSIPIKPKNVPPEGKRLVLVTDIDGYPSMRRKYELWGYEVFEEVHERRWWMMIDQAVYDAEIKAQEDRAQSMLSSVASPDVTVKEGFDTPEGLAARNG